MVGTATALALQARGYDVVLVDRSAPGSETSHGNAGFIQGEAYEPYALPCEIATLWRMALKRDNSVDWDFAGLLREARPLFAYWRHSTPARHQRISLTYAALIRRANADHARWITASHSQDLIRTEGYRQIFRDPAAFDLQVRKAEQWRTRYGSAHEAEDTAALAAAEPALRQKLSGAVRWRDTWTCTDPGALVEAYAELFRKQGGHVMNAEAIGLRQTGRGWQIASSAGAIETEQVVVALGPWSPAALAPLGYRIRMVRKRGYHMNFHQSSLQPHLNLALIDADFGAVYAPMRAGLRIATGADLSSAKVTGLPRQLIRAHAAASALLEFGAPLEQSAWSGTRPCMPDMLPVVGAAPRHEGLWFNFGHGHQGFTLGPTTGNLLAGAMAGEADPVTLALAPSRSALN
jgi:D-amino-acid dehydrogenase